MATVLALEHIISDNTLRDGFPIIAGSPLRVAELMAYSQQNSIPLSDLADLFFLDLAQVHAAFAYYYQHQSALDAEISQFHITPDSPNEDWPDEDLWRVVYQRLAWLQIQRLENLGELLQYRDLTDYEIAERKHLADLSRHQMLSRSQAMAILQARGYSLENYFDFA